ncbi:MAG: TorF family putative porin [Phenylobacterium sp.]
MKCVLALASLLFPLAPAAHAADWGGVFSAITLASDYRYQGVSESRGRPVVQGYVHWQNAEGLFAGVFATQVDFGYAGAPSYELDAYAGKTFRLDAGQTELKLQAMSSSFPDNRTPGPTFDFLQASAQLKRTAGPWTVSALTAYVPASSYGSGPVARAEGEADYAVSKALTLKAQLGRQGLGRGHDRTCWSLGAAAVWKTLTFELRYVDTDRTRANCGFQPKACDAAVVGTLTVSLPPIL